MADTHWTRIKKILDDSLERWREENGRDPKMKAVHEGHIGWTTKEELMQSVVYDLRLIEPDKIGNGLARETNLVKILTRNVGGYRRMPSRGPYLSPEEIGEIVEWIDAGTPD